MPTGFSRRDDPGDSSPECRESLTELGIDPAITQRNHFGRPRDVIDESEPIGVLLEPRIGPYERRQQGQGPAPSVRRGGGPFHQTSSRRIPPPSDVGTSRVNGPRTEKRAGISPDMPARRIRCPQGPSDGGLRPSPRDHVDHRHRARARFVVTPHRVCDPSFEWSGLRKHPDVGLEPMVNGGIPLGRSQSGTRGPSLESPRLEPWGCLLQAFTTQVLELPGVADAVPLGPAALGDGGRVGLLPPLVRFPVLGLRLHGVSDLLTPNLSACATRHPIMKGRAPRYNPKRRVSACPGRAGPAAPTRQ
jgi:hypothetical protein